MKFDEISEQDDIPGILVTYCGDIVTALENGNSGENQLFLRRPCEKLREERKMPFVNQTLKLK
jgi:hypothetical protein